MSSPVSDTVTCRIGADFGCSNRPAARAFNCGNALTMAGSDIGQVWIGTRSHDRRALKPISIVLPALRACRPTRRRLCSGVVTIGAQATSNPARSSVAWTRACFQAL